MHFNESQLTPRYPPELTRIRRHGACRAPDARMWPCGGGPGGATVIWRRRVRQADRGSRGVQVVIQRPPSPFAALDLITEISSVSAQQVVHREPAGSLLLDQAGPTLAAGEAERTSAERFRQLALPGREPSEVAGIAVDAIRAGRFYILTSTNRNEAVRRRAEEILAGDPPAPPFP